MLGHRLVSQPKYLLYATIPYLELRIHFPGSDLGGDPVPILLIHGSNVVLQLKGSQCDPFVGLGCANSSQAE